MAEPVWVPPRAVLTMHAELIAEHGGHAGPPRSSNLDAALALPRQLWPYADRTPPLARLAAAYGFALARGHCFPVGNKRIALAVIDVFLQLNGSELQADEADAAQAIESLAAGLLSEDALTEWLTRQSGPL